MSDESCPSCDGSLRGLRPGETVQPYDRCPPCEEREAALLAKWKDVMVATPVFGQSSKVPRIQFDPNTK